MDDVNKSLNKNELISNENVNFFNDSSDKLDKLSDSDDLYDSDEFTDSDESTFLYSNVKLWDIEKLEVTSSKEVFYIQFDIENCYNICPNQTKRLVNQLKDADCPEIGKYIDISAIGWDDDKLKNLISKNVCEIVQSGGDFSKIEKCYDEKPEWTLDLINRLKVEKCTELGKYLDINVLRDWSKEKLENLFSNNVWTIVHYGDNFEKIMKCYDENRDRTMQEINQLCDMSLKPGECKKVYILDWDVLKLEYLFSDKVKQIVQSGADPRKIEDCYNKDCFRTNILINKLIFRDLSELVKYIKPSMLDWDYNKKLYLISNEVNEIVKNGSDFDVIEKCYEDNTIWTQKRIDQLKNNNCLGLGLYIFHNIRFLLHWTDQKMEDLFTKNVWTIVNQGSNFYEMVQCYDKNPDQMRKLIS